METWTKKLDRRKANEENSNLVIGEQETLMWLTEHKTQNAECWVEQRKKTIQMNQIQEMSSAGAEVEEEESTNSPMHTTCEGNDGEEKKHRINGRWRRKVARECWNVQHSVLLNIWCRYCITLHVHTRHFGTAMCGVAIRSIVKENGK